MSYATYFYSFKKYLFVYLAALGLSCGIQDFFSCGLQTLNCNTGDRSLTRGWIQAPCIGNTKSSHWTPREVLLRYFFFHSTPLCVCVCVRTQLCPTLCNPINCSPPVSVYGIFQARILEGLAISFSNGSLPARDRTWISCSAGSFFMKWATREAHTYAYI